VTWLSSVNNDEYLTATRNQLEVTELTQHRQSIVAIASYAAIGDNDGLSNALKQGLNKGLTVNQIKELLIQVYAYCGFPRSLMALGTFKEVLSEREANGVKDLAGESAATISGMDKYAQGAQTLSELSGVPVDAPAAWYEDFAPGINTFLKEHLFADIFGRGVLTNTDRELGTVSMLTALGGVEPMASGHIGICRHLGVTTPQLNALLDIIEHNIGFTKVEPIRKIVNQ
jgi:alkylhydroperoxidase/carboxymuconolactone decarboxylase family protein YurZ